MLLVNEEELSWPHLLAIHGARSDYTKLNPLLFPLQRRGIASLSFNLSGHNEASNVSLEDTSLRKNLQEALRFAQVLGPSLHTILGHSMGGALALKVAEVHRSSVKKIILSCPALYSESAYRRPFGSSFRQEISIPFGFIDSASLKFLHEFEGELMLIMGQYDGLKAIEFGGIAGRAAGRVKVVNERLEVLAVNSAIPFEVIDVIENSVAPHRFRKVILPGCDHAVSGWLRANPMQGDSVASQITNFLNS